MSADLQSSFVGAVGEAYAIAPDALARLAEALELHLTEARDAWPGVHVSGADFAAYLADRVPDDGDPGAALERMRVADLYLACACSVGAPGAADAFERAVMSEVPKAVARVDSGAQFIDEVSSNVRVKLLVGDGGRPPRVSAYLGRGPLSAFAQVVALREAQSLKRRGRREEPADSAEVQALPLGGDGPEAANLRAEVQGSFAAAFREALAALSPRHRAVLRLYLVEGVGSETIARMYGVHRATVARWVADARDAAFKGTRERLMRELGMPRAAVESLVVGLASQLDVNLATFLGGE